MIGLMHKMQVQYWNKNITDRQRNGRTNETELNKISDIILSVGIIFKTTQYNIFDPTVG